MTFQQRQHRLTRLFSVLIALMFVPLLMNMLDIGDFTPAGMTLYTLLLLAFGLPAAYLAVQHARASHQQQERRS